MATNKRITDLTDYKSVLPYASEMFGVYQPMIGWKSKRLMTRLQSGLYDSQNSLLKAFTRNYTGSSQVDFSVPNCNAQIKQIDIGSLFSGPHSTYGTSVLVQTLVGKLPKEKPPIAQEWEQFINEHSLSNILNQEVSTYYSTYYREQCVILHNPGDSAPTNSLSYSRVQNSFNTIQKSEDALVIQVTRSINDESALAAALLNLIKKGTYRVLEKLFYADLFTSLNETNNQISALLNNEDPFATFDPKKDIKNVSLSPLGIVHLFRQYFFELDTFLGTPTGHVWLSPGSTVELIEVSTRRVYVEKIIEQSLETTKKSESSDTTKDEISEAVKEDNKTDLKLGASLTVNQSWGTGNATATASLNMDQSQSTARETTHKRMREQSTKLSTEIKQSYKSTFKTVTETTDTSSKRYTLTNSGQDLINYELRRKMRQVGVQVQDIGTYLCWETFVDEPGKQLGLANLVNIAKPADLVDVPNQNLVPPAPDNVAVSFTSPLTWNFGDDNPQTNNADGFRPLDNAVPVPPAPEGYEVKYPNGMVDVFQISGNGNDFSGVWGFKGKLNGVSSMSIGPWIDGSMEWDDQINFVVGGVVIFTPTAAKKQEIDNANKAIVAAGKAATIENERKTKEAYINAAKQRIEYASSIATRKYEDLRDEERIIVYRNLISALMSDILYKIPESVGKDQTRHTVSELINSIFDIDKMLYFVAPEWWKPRTHFHQFMNGNISDDAIFNNSLSSWNDLDSRTDNYYITEKSQYAKMGSSLGWLLQLDGDDLRNAFLNAPWVKAVIPIRPGKELEATNWLQQMHVEGTNGLDSLYEAPQEELDTIMATLGIGEVTISDAIKYLCGEVAAKYRDSLKVGRYPKEEINDDNRVSSTPVDKVYEHGFYPLTGGFKAITTEGYEVFDQWIEVLPTDQVVPVEVKYDPKTGRQV